MDKSKKRVWLWRVGWKVNGRYYILAGLIALATIIGAMVLLDKGKIAPVSSYTSMLSDSRLESMSYEEKRYWTMIDDQFVDSVQAAGQWGAILYAGLWAASGVLLIFLILRMCRLKDRKMSALAAYYTDLGVKKSLAWLESELEAPEYESYFLSLTESWILGRTGMAMSAVAIPLQVIEGFYTYIRPWRPRFLRREIPTYRILIVDCFGECVLLAAGESGEMEKAAALMALRCPLARQGDYSDFLLDHCALEQDKRDEIAENFLKAGSRKTKL